MLQVGVRCDQHTEAFLLGDIEQLAVLQLRPAALVGSDDFIFRKGAPQRFGLSLIEQDAHLCSGKRAAGSMIEYRANLFQADAREPVYELRRQRSVFEIFK